MNGNGFSLYILKIANPLKYKIAIGFSSSSSSVLMISIPLPPTQDQLPYDDGIPMETQRHKIQMDLLIDTFTIWLENREDGYATLKICIIRV